MEGEGKRNGLDLLAMGVAALVLLGTAFWNLMTVLNIPNFKDMLSEMGSAAVPTITRLVFGLAELYVFHATSLILLLMGFALLFATRDRLRGIVYCLSVSMLLAVLTVVIREALWLPMVKVIQSVGP